MPSGNVASLVEGLDIQPIDRSKIVSLSFISSKVLTKYLSIPEKKLAGFYLVGYVFEHHHHAVLCNYVNITHSEGFCHFHR